MVYTQTGLHVDQLGHASVTAKRLLSLWPFAPATSSRYICPQPTRTLSPLSVH
jgi:hypothetical protein